MTKGNQIIQFGENVAGYAVPVLNEREIRAAAGLMFLALLLAFMFILFRQDFLPVKYVIVVFFTDFIIRVFISPRFSPVLIIGRLGVGSQVPEYVGAPQKKFAWQIGLALSGLMFLHLVVLNCYSMIATIACFLCLTFLFFESAFGICLGCLVYGLLYKNEPFHCAGEACAVKTKQAIQKTSWAQVLVVLASILFVLLVIPVFNDHLIAHPKNLKEVINSLHITSGKGKAILTVIL
jgi:hypothetical protein